MQMWLEEALKYRNCREALQNVLAQLGSDTNFAPSQTDILDVFNKLRGQTGGGGVFVDVAPVDLDKIVPPDKRRTEPPGGGGLSGFYYTDPGNWRTRQRWSVVFLRGGGYSDSQPLAYERVPYDYVLALIHELTHNAPNDFSGFGRNYEHDEMDAAAKKLGSRDFDQYVREHCIPRKYWEKQ